MIAAAVIVASMPLNTPEGVFVSILALAVVTSLIVAGIATGRTKRYVPMARRKGSSENKKLLERMAETREAKHAAVSVQASESVDVGGGEGAPTSGIPQLGEAEERADGGVRREAATGRRFPWLSVVTLGLIFLFLMVMGIAGLEGMLPPEMASSPVILLILFFTGLFAVEFMPFEKLRFALWAALPVLGLIVLGFFVDLLRIWPVLLVALGLGALGLIAWNARKEKSPEELNAWRKKVLSGRKPGEKTARILGSSNEVRLKEKPPDSMERGFQMKQKGMYFKNP